MTLKIPSSFRGTNGKEAYERIINEKAEEENIIQNPIQPIVQPNLYSNSDFWTIENVNYKGKNCKVNLLKTLLDNGNVKTQDNWAEYSINAKKNNNFYTGDMPLQFSLFRALYNSPDSPQKEEAREFIQKSMREKYLMTLTRVQNTSSGKDKIIHNYKIPNEECFMDENIVGPDREIIQDDKNALEALLLVKDVNEVKSVLNWINQTPVWIWRVNSKPDKLDERIARFDAVSDWADLSCNWNPSYSSSSLGVMEV